MKYLLETLLILSFLFIIGISSFVVWDAYTSIQEQETVVIEYEMPYWQSIEESNQCSNQSITDMISRSNIAETGSMRPTINKHSTILTIPYNESISLVQGEIVGVKTSNTSNTLHRVTGIEDNYFTMKGDNNEYPDGTRYKYTNISYIVCAIKF